MDILSEEEKKNRREWMGRVKRLRLKRLRKKNHFYIMVVDGDSSQSVVINMSKEKQLSK